MQMLSLPASMQQELAARALRACMAAEAALASLRAECKPLQAASPQRVLALKKNMGNAHRSLRLQIEACESFSLSATAAFKQLCDVFFNADSAAANHNNVRFDRHRLAPARAHSPPSDDSSSMTRLTTLAASLDGELPECGLWRPHFDALYESVHKVVHKVAETGDPPGVAAQKHSAGVQVKAQQETITWRPDADVVFSRLPSPETDNDVAHNGDGNAARGILAADARQLPSSQDDTPHPGGLHECRFHQDSDASDSDPELRSEISTLCRNSTLPFRSTESPMHDASEARKLSEAQPTSSAPTDPPTSEKPLPNSTVGISEHEHHATQTGEPSADSNTVCQFARLDGFAQQANPPADESPRKDDTADARLGSTPSLTDLPRPESPSSTEAPGRCDLRADERPADTRSAMPPSRHLSPGPALEPWASQTLSSSAPQFSWSSATQTVGSLMDMTRPSSPPEGLDPAVVSYAALRASFTRLSSPSPDLPMYSSRPQPLTPPSGNTKIFHQEHDCTAAAGGASPSPLAPAPKAVAPYEPRELALTLDPLPKKETLYSPPSPPYADQNYYEEPNVVPLTPSLYTLKTRSIFACGIKPGSSSLPAVSAAMQGPCGHHFGPGVLAMSSTGLSMSPGYRRPLTSSGAMSAAASRSPAYFPTAEKQQGHALLPDRPLLPQFTLSPINSTLSSSSSSWETMTSSKISGGGGGATRRESGGIEYYRKEFESLQEQFPRAHGSFQEPWGASPGSTLAAQQIGAHFGSLGPTPPAAGATLHSMRQLPRPASPQRPHRSSVITEMERQGGLPFSGGYGHVLRHSSAQSHSGDDGSKISASKISDSCSPEGAAGGFRNPANGFRDVVGRELNKTEFLQELSNWPGPAGLKWDEDSSDGEDEDAPGGRAMAPAPEAEATDSDDDSDSLGTRREWHTILDNLPKGGESSRGGPYCEYPRPGCHKGEE